MRVHRLLHTHTQCRTWRGEDEITADPNVPVQHGAAIHFTIQRDIPWQAGASHATTPDDDDSDGLHLLQKSSGRNRLQLDALLTDVVTPVWVKIDCQKVLFLREQLPQWMNLQPTFDHFDVDWHPATAKKLAQTLKWTTETPLGFSFYTDGSATHKSPLATAAVVLIVHTDGGERWVAISMPNVLVSKLHHERKPLHSFWPYDGVARCFSTFTTYNRGSSLRLIVNRLQELLKESLAAITMLIFWCLFVPFYIGWNIGLRQLFNGLT